MGLIKMFTSAVGSTFADQVVEYFRCEDMSTKILCQPATLVKRGKTVNNGTEGVISNGSRFDVAVNQAALLIENGRVHDFVIGTQETAGQYKYDSTVSPKIYSRWSGYEHHASYLHKPQTSAWKQDRLRQDTFQRWRDEPHS